MNNQLTQKERTLLQDQLSHEEICIRKYSSYAQQTQNQDIKNMFNQFASEEQEHYSTINQLLGQSGTNRQNRQNQQNMVNQNTFSQEQAGNGETDDASMLTDMLMTEKYVSGTYDTAIFESSNPSIRKALQHIQKDEQNHGEGIFNYMQQNGMYQPQ